MTVQETKGTQCAPWVRKIPWRRRWQRAPVFLPGNPWTEELGGLQSMDHKESDTTEHTHTYTHTHILKVTLSG